MAFTIQDLLTQWESVGIFDYVLPFLLIFAVIFGILTSFKLFGRDSKPVNIIIAIVIALMALQWNYLPIFMAELFPRLGVGLSVILALVILVGMFIPDEEMRFWGWGLGAIAFITAIVVVGRSFDVLGWSSSTASAETWVGWIAGAVLIIGLIIAVGASGGSKEADKDFGKVKYGGRTSS